MHRCQRTHHPPSKQKLGAAKTAKSFMSMLPSFRSCCSWDIKKWRSLAVITKGRVCEAGNSHVLVLFTNYAFTVKKRSRPKVPHAVSKHEEDFTCRARSILCQLGFIVMAWGWGPKETAPAPPGNPQATAWTPVFKDNHKGSSGVKCSVLGGIVPGFQTTYPWRFAAFREWRSMQQRLGWWSNYIQLLDER